jgi:hypothetical protein
MMATSAMAVRSMAGYAERFPFIDDSIGMMVPIPSNALREHHVVDLMNANKIFIHTYIHTTYIHRTYIHTYIHT